MKLEKALFFLAVLCFATTVANYRHIPNRSKMFAEERHYNSMPFLRNLEGSDLNSHANSSSNDTMKPVTVRLQGNTELGYYYVTLFFGTPVQKQTLIVDTGSVITTIPCDDCGKDCGNHHFDQPFNHKTSNSFEEFKCQESFGNYECYDCNGKCPFHISYVEGSSYGGHFNKDYLTFGNEIEDNYSLLRQANSSTDSEKQALDQINEIINKRKIFMPFGCTNKETKLFYDQEADGILGLGVNTNTQSSPPNILDALNLHNSGFSRAFSLCLAPNGGYFTLGGHNAAYHLPNEKVQYTRFSDAFGQYKVFLNKIEVEGLNIGLTANKLNSGEGAFFDSGTTLTHVPKATYDALRSNLDNYCTGNEKCGNVTRDDHYCYRYHSNVYATLNDFYSTFPTFKFFFGREENNLAQYEWKAEDYLYEKDQHLYCLGLSHYERETILGGTFMKNHDILFDKENKRIGFARANCNGVQEVSKPIYVETSKVDDHKKDSDSDHSDNSDNSDDEDVNETNNHPFQTALVLCVVGALVSGVIGIGYCLYKDYKKKPRYQNMRNIRIEIPSAGLSEDRLDSSIETPQSNDQPRQQVHEERINIGGPGAAEEASPRIKDQIEDL